MKYMKTILKLKRQMNFENIMMKLKKVVLKI
jgi:hypothetical protein